MEKKKMYWTTSEVRSMIFDNNVSKITLISLIHLQKIPAIRLGNRWYIPTYWVDRQIRIAQGVIEEVNA